MQGFLQGLPRGVPYAIELRNAELLTPAYARVLEATGALHAHNVWGGMPSVLDQARLIPPLARKPLIVRWLMRSGDDYEGARSRFMPFNRLAEPDLANRDAIATLISKATIDLISVRIWCDLSRVSKFAATPEIGRHVLTRQGIQAARTKTRRHCHNPATLHLPSSLAVSVTAACLRGRSQS